MGFRLNRKYVLYFEGAMEGAEVRLRATSIDTVMRLRQVTDLTEIAQLLSEHIEDWNLEDANGEPLATTPDAITGDLEEVVLARIAREWFKAATGVTAPLDPKPDPFEDSIPVTAN